MKFIDTHAHIDVADFDVDRDEMIARAKQNGVAAIFVPATDLVSSQAVLSICRRYCGYAYPMIGLHPEEVNGEWNVVISKIKALLSPEVIAIGEIGLDFYWSREYEKEQCFAFERQVEWAIERQLPLMIHCRKAQNEMISILKHYEKDLPPGIFHCFTGNEYEAQELLKFENFMLGIGGILTFKKSNLPTVLTKVPLNRIVLETDSPYMAPVPMRGKRNESAYVKFVLEHLAKVYNTTPDTIAEATNTNVHQIFAEIKF